jgi:hypothetical protein
VGGSWKIGLGRTMQGRRAVFDRRLESFAEVGWRCVGSFSQSIGAVTCCEWIKRRAAIDVRVTMPIGEVTSSFAGKMPAVSVCVSSMVLQVLPS